MDLHFRRKAPNLAYTGFKVCWIQKNREASWAINRTLPFRWLCMAYIFLFWIFTFGGLPCIPGHIHVYISTDVGNNITETQVHGYIYACNYIHMYTRNLIGRSWVESPKGWAISKKFRFGVLFMAHTYTLIYIYINIYIYYVWMYVCMYVCMHACMNACM